MPWTNRELVVNRYSPFVSKDKLFRTDLTEDTVHLPSLSFLICQWYFSVRANGQSDNNLSGTVTSKHQQYWIEQAHRLKRSPRGGQRAPHKPVLLLTLCDLAASGRLSDHTVFLNDINFAETFLTFWDVVRRNWSEVSQQTDRPQMRLPMFHIKTEGFCKPVDVMGQPATTAEATVATQIETSFYELLHNPVFRKQFANTMIESQFHDDPEVQTALQILTKSAGYYNEIPLVAEEPAKYQSVRYARDRRFRLDVVSAYDHTCALTGVRLVTSAATSLVDAAHIKNFTDTWDNSVSNGIALAKNAHWSFDEFLWTITPDFIVAVAPESAFKENGPESHLLRPLAGKRIVLPSDFRSWPSQDALDWHGANFIKRWKSC